VTAAFRLGDEPLTLEVISQIARAERTVEIGAGARAAMDRARAVVDAVVAGGDAAPAVYGVNTGFGALAEVRISVDRRRGRGFPRSSWIKGRKLVPPKAMKRMAVHSKAGLAKAPTLAERVLKPPVLTVVNMWVMASKAVSPQARNARWQMIERPR
jgi:hypothetical protein